MVLSQFLITAANNGSVFPLGISGKASIRVLGVEYGDGQHGAGNTDPHGVQIVSDALYFPYSPAKYITFVSHSSASAVIDQGKNDYHLANVALNSGIRLQVIDPATRAQPDDFILCVLTLSIEALNRNVEVE